MKKEEFSITIGGKTLSATFTDLASRAHGSVLIRYGNSVILATAVMSHTEKEGSDFFPLTVDYEEKFYASGQILGSRFVRREGKPSDEAILSGRIVDRTIRPMFDQWIRNEVQVIITTLSVDEDDPDILGVLGASLALATSEIPWNGPVSAIRLAKMKDDDNLIINPNYKARGNDNIEFEMVICGKEGKISMIEFAGDESNEETVGSALEFASVEIEKIQNFQKKIIEKISRQKKVLPKPEMPAEVFDLFKEKISPKLKQEVFSGIPGDQKIQELKEKWKKLASGKFGETILALAENLFEQSVDDLFHEEVLENENRPDRRKLDEIRPLFAEAGGISPTLHGSGTFYRGDTHILSVLTLAGPKDSQVIDKIEGVQGEKRFMHHYNFPPFSTGETGRVGNTNRRMIGHGALAEKALAPIIPPKEIFPYTIRIVSEALSSNGSTSMGSVCASTLALMDGGVPIKKPVAGIASGLVIESNAKDRTPRYKILTDIQGPEDHYGDMDFKVAGTKDGITAIQMDIKVDSVPIEILAEALEKAKVARLKILSVIEKAINIPRKEISPRAPKILVLQIKPDQIGMIIGPGGKIINEIKDRTKTDSIDIGDDGTVIITGKNGSAEKAKSVIETMTHEYKPGERFQGTITRILDFGAFVKIAPNTEGLVHISEIAPFRVNKVTEILKEGEIVPVIIKEIDEKKRLSLSIKAADHEFAARKVKNDLAKDDSKTEKDETVI